MSEFVEPATPEAVSTPTGTVPAASDQPAQTSPQAGEAPKPEQKQETTEEQPEKRGKNRFERRLDRAYRREAEAKARAEFLEKRLNEIEAKIGGPKDQVDGEPKLADYDDIEKYAAAKAEFREKKAIEAYEAKQRQDQAKSQQQRIVSEWTEKAERGSDKYDDWDDVVGEITPSNPMTVALMRSENAEDVAYHLGKNLKEATRIAGLDPISQMLAIGALSAKLQLDPPKPKQPSKAPAPITPVSGKSEAPSDSDLEKAEMKEFMKIRNRQLGRTAAK